MKMKYIFLSACCGMLVALASPSSIYYTQETISIPVSPPQVELIYEGGSFDTQSKQSCKKDPLCVKLAEAIVYEARGEPEVGMVAVAFTILNRVQDKRWPNTIYDVIHQPYQFSYLMDKHKQKPPTKEDWKRAETVASGVLNGIEPNPVGKATHYHTKRVKPVWSKKLIRVAEIGQHVFYTNTTKYR